MPSEQRDPDSQQTHDPAADPLGYTVYARTLWERIEQALNRDQGDGKKLGDDPLVIGIFGEWGAGKSYLLGKVHERARDYGRDRVQWRKLDGGGFGLTIPVLFQPWKYEHEEHLHVPMLLHILSALEQGLKEAQTSGEKLWQAMQKPGDAIAKVLPEVLPKVVELMGRLVAGTAAAVEPVTASTAATGLAGAKALAKVLAWFKKPPVNVAANLKYTGDGRYFYEVHRVLKAVTRPREHDGYLQGVVINTPIAINFVIFVDDLDRCLPEKAVAVLELIKTVFNVESFAFVLALDDEVIERGIGHRYKEYALGNKKPEMPITGFEYLEKIVHLPFRLPALTRDDALRFMQMKEQELLTQRTPAQRDRPGGEQAWFGSPMPAQRHGAGRLGDGGLSAGRLSGDLMLSKGMAPGHDVHAAGDAGEADDGPAQGQAPLHLHLGHLVVNVFDAYVPRKLVRVVELFHQVARIAEARGRPLGAVLGGAVDARLVLALVLLQLFQPELYRCLKRTGTGFDVLRRSFANGEMSAEFSDQDVLAWACYGTRSHLEPGSAQAGASTEESAKEPAKAPAPMPTKEPVVPPVSLRETLERIARLSDDKRHPAQRIRLPVAERLLEHRAAQRHVFDPLKLFAALNASGELAPLSDTTRIQSYYSLLALAPQGSDEAVVLSVVSRVADVGAGSVELEPLTVQGAGGPVQPVASGELPSVRRAPPEAVPLSDVRGIYSALISAEASEQDEVASRTGLGAGQVIATRSASELKTLVVRWLTESGADAARKQQQLLRGLLALGPLLDDAMAKEFWEGVKDCVTLPEKPGEPAEDPVLCALYADVRGVLRQDDRFEPAAPWLLRKRFPGHTGQDEPLPGFVRIPAGEFTMGHADERDNPPRTVRIAEPFYIARTLTTVDQYAHFVDAGGYTAGADKFWDSQGLAWRNGKFDSAVTEKAYKDWLAQRSGELRLRPWRWEAQRPHGSRPVWGISWFEARAYARWLDAQLRTKLESTSGLQRHRVMLPMELQWERAARARTLAAAHTGQWPWDHDGKGVEEQVARLANIEPSGVGRACSVGALAPNAIGLYDMAGNLWEWLDNLYAAAPDEFARIERDRILVTHEELVKSDRPTVRGGSWVYRPEHARCSSRLRDRPDGWNYDLGFRVVLSLA